MDSVVYHGDRQTEETMESHEAERIHLYLSLHSCFTGDLLCNGERTKQKITAEIQKTMEGMTCQNCNSREQKKNHHLNSRLIIKKKQEKTNSEEKTSKWNPATLAKREKKSELLLDVANDSLGRGKADGQGWGINEKREAAAQIYNPSTF